jgi:hypothetical protein
LCGDGFSCSSVVLAIWDFFGSSAMETSHRE